eukprot:13459538-Heterocapsa_arctica.AAC.1
MARFAKGMLAPSAGVCSTRAELLVHRVQQSALASFGHTGNERDPGGLTRPLADDLCEASGEGLAVEGAC